jgi:hypothetical protein
MVLAFSVMTFNVNKNNDFKARSGNLHFAIPITWEV